MRGERLDDGYLVFGGGGSVNEKLTEIAAKLRSAEGVYFAHFRLVGLAIDEINRVQSEVVNSLAARVAAQSELLSKRAEK